jgi:hypothetical protein
VKRFIANGEPRQINYAICFNFIKINDQFFIKVEVEESKTGTFGLFQLTEKLT